VANELILLVEDNPKNLKLVRDTVRELLDTAPRILDKSAQ
jgi:hypothetical protein